MFRFSPRTVQLSLIPSTVLLAVLVIGLRYCPQWQDRVDRLDSPMRLDSDPRQSEELRQVAARSLATEQLIQQLIDGEVTLKEATQHYISLNENKAFKYLAQQQTNSTNLEASACVMLLKRVRGMLCDEPDRLEEISDRLRSEYIEAYGELHIGLDRQPII